MSVNTENILPSIKSQLGIDVECDAFDSQLTTHINAVFMILKRMGIGPKEGFIITQDGDELWTDFMPDGTSLEAVKTYVHLKVRMIFDPPTGGAAAEAIKESIREFEWSLNFEEDCLKDGENQNE